VKDPTAKIKWVLSHCSQCHRDTHFHRIKGHTFRCIHCEREKEIREVDRDRDGLLE